jgi:hypothetical protein
VQITYIGPVERSCQGKQKTGLGQGNETEPRISQQETEKVQPFFRTGTGKMKGQVDAHGLFFNTAFFHYFRMQIRDFHALSREKPYDGNGDCLQKSSFLPFHRRLSKGTPKMLQESINCSEYCRFHPLIYTHHGKSLHSPILAIHQCPCKNMHPTLKHSHQSIVILFSE